MKNVARKVEKIGKILTQVIRHNLWGFCCYCLYDVTTTTTVAASAVTVDVTAVTTTESNYYYNYYYYLFSFSFFLLTVGRQTLLFEVVERLTKLTNLKYLSTQNNSSFFFFFEKPQLAA